MKIEGGLIKYEYSNKFNIRVNNFRKTSTSYSSLDSFVKNMHLRDIMEQEIAKTMKFESS